MLRVGNVFLVNQIRRIGSIRSAGGSIAKRGEVIEEEYFCRKRREQLQKLRMEKKQLKESAKKN